MTRPRPQEGRSRSSGARRVWAGIALTLCLVEAVLILADAGLIGSPLWRTQSWQYGGFWSGLLHGWTPNYAAQPVAMFVTYAFLHTGWHHLLGNVLTLGWLGMQLENRFGGRALAALYGIAVLGGGATTGLLATSPRPVVGASGAIMGLVAAWIAADAQDMARTGEPWPPILGMIALRCGVLAVLNWAAVWADLGGLAWQAHLGGFVFAALAMALVPALRPRF